MDETTHLAQQTPQPERTQLPRLRFPAVCLLIFWLLYFVVAALNKPYFLGFMYGLASTGLFTLLVFLWWWFNRGLRMWEKCAGFAFMLGEAWLVGKFSHPTIGLFTVWLVGLPTVVRPVRRR